MFLSNILNKMLGRVKISIEGFFIEKFINICTYRKIKLNNLKRLNGCILETEVSISDFRKLRKICRKTKCRLKILDKKGIPFLLHRYRKRKIAIVVVFCIIGLIVFANNLVWEINVNCEDIDTKNRVESQLSQMGIRKYTLKGKLDFDNIKNDIMINIQDITWIEMDLKGVLLEVNVKTGNLPPEVVDENEYCNIVATKTGIIDRIIVKNGIKVADVGQIVEKGDLLISGVITSEFVDTWQLHADGEVYAKVWYAKTIEVPFKEEKFSYTGNKDTYNGMILGNKKVFFGKVSTNYEEYDTIVKEKKIKVFDIDLPVKACELMIYEKQTQNIERTYEEALEYGNDILETMLLEVVPQESQVVQKFNNTVTLEDGLKIELVYECLEQIGTKEKISLVEGEEI